MQDHWSQGQIPEKHRKTKLKKVTSVRYFSGRTRIFRYIRKIKVFPENFDFWLFPVWLVYIYIYICLFIDWLIYLFILYLFKCCHRTNMVRMLAEFWPHPPRHTRLRSHPNSELPTLELRWLVSWMSLRGLKHYKHVYDWEIWESDRGNYRIGIPCSPSIKSLRFRIICHVHAHKPNPTCKQRGRQGL